MDMVLNLIKQFQLNPTFFVMLGLFVGTYLLFSQLALHRVSNSLVERDNRIAGRSQEAEKIGIELAEISQTLKVETSLAHIEANKIFVEMRNKAQQEQREILNAARHRATTDIKEAAKNVEAKFKEEIKKIEAETLPLARQILDQLMISKKIKPSTRINAETEA